MGRTRGGRPCHSPRRGSYNELFLLYVALFSTSSFAFVKTFATFDKTSVAAYFTERAPRRLAGIFMIVSAVATAAIWLMPPRPS